MYKKKANDQTAFKELEKLLPPPGHFVVLDPNDFVRVPIKQKRNTHKLNIFKEPVLAKKVYAIYAKCWNNSISLLNEAKLLFQNKYYARAVAIGITAWEELGKSQIAADYYSGVISESAYNAAFRDHRLKQSYLARTGVIDGTGEFKVGFNEAIGDRLEIIRQDALYVSENNDPKEKFSKADADFVIRRVWEHKEYIHYAEELNERIGSKALFR